MFSPVFSYTNKIVNNIARIEFDRGIMHQSMVLPEIEVILRKNALIRSVHASTAIEGNTLTVKEVNNLYKRLTVVAREKEKQEVMNYFDFLEKIDKYHKKGKITEELLLKIHREISKNTLSHKFFEGHYRTVEVRVENLRTGKVRYRPPDYVKLPKLVKNLVEWINSSENISPLIVAGVAHYELVRIHPFVDGNGRTARALAALILFTRGYDTRYVTVDEYYDKDRKSYLDALKTADDSDDLTEWLEYFTQGFLISISKVVNELLKPLMIKPALPEDMDLTENQSKIISFIQENGKITNSETRKLLNVSPQSAYKNLQKLQDLGILTRKGSGRSTHYTFGRVDERLRKKLMKNLIYY